MFVIIILDGSEVLTVFSLLQEAPEEGAEREIVDTTFSCMRGRSTA